MSQNAVTKIKLEKFTIKGIEILGETIASFDIYESVTQPGITGEIEFADWQGLNEIEQIFAGDDIEIAFSSEDKSVLSMKFKLYACENMQIHDKQTYKTMKYQFCSPWLIDALVRQISKPYKEKYLHEIIEDLLKECGAQIGFIEPMKQKMECFVTPLWTAIHSIKHILTFAKNKNDVGGYVLFTDLKTGKVNCCTIDYMYKKSLGYYEEFLFHPGNEFYEGKIRHITMESNYDIIRHINQGMNKYEVEGFWYDKNKFIVTKDTIKDYKHKHLGTKFPVNPEYLDKKYWSKEYTTLYPKQAAAVTNEKDFMDLLDGKQYFRYTMLFSDIFKLNISTQGETTRRVGWLAKVDVPSQNEETNKDGYKDYKGDYLIRDIRHTYSQGVYMQFICLASDGFKMFTGNALGW
jgi:hypothetical protein